MNRQRIAFTLTFLIAAGLGARQLTAQLVPSGPEVRVDTLAGDRYPNCPKIGVRPDKSFEISWDYGGNFPPQIKARHYNPAGAPTDPHEVLVAGLSYYPVTLAVTPVSTGFRVLMEGIDDLGGPPRFFRRRIDTSGVPAGTPRPAGTFGITDWISSGSGDTLFAGHYDSTLHRLSVREVDSLGVPTGPSFILNSRPLDAQARPRIVPLSDGGWVAVFTGYSLTGPPLQVLRARRFNAANVPTGPDFDVNSIPAGAPGVAPFLGLDDFVVTPGPAGRFAVSWIFVSPGTAIRFRSFNAAGVPIAPDRTVATEELLAAPVSAAFDDAGRVLVLWTTHLFGPASTFLAVLKAQLLRPNGTALGPPFGPQSAASGAFDEPFCGSVAWAGNSWLIAWGARKADLQPSAVFLRRFH